jgi:hypothetical protein
MAGAGEQKYIAGAGEQKWLGICLPHNSKQEIILLWFSREVNE